MNKNITLIRACKATIIPAGDEVTLAEGTTFTIAQSLGGSVTLRDNAGMYRVGEAELDALGEEIKQEVLKEKEEAEDQGPFSEEKVWDAMRGCYDPEIPVNIVDLGLVYSCDVAKDANGERLVSVVMTLTAPGCGMGDILVEDVRSKISLVPTIERVSVELTFDPPWNHQMMSDAARLQTGMM